MSLANVNLANVNVLLIEISLEQAVAPHPLLSLANVNYSYHARFPWRSGGAPFFVAGKCKLELLEENLSPLGSVCALSELTPSHGFELSPRRMIHRRIFFEYLFGSSEGLRKSCS